MDRSSIENIDCLVRSICKVVDSTTTTAVSAIVHTDKGQNMGLQMVGTKKIFVDLHKGCGFREKHERITALFTLEITHE